jgi:hypothetical protein
MFIQIYPVRATGGNWPLLPTINFNIKLFYLEIDKLALVTQIIVFYMSDSVLGISNPKITAMTSFPPYWTCSAHERQTYIN